MQSRSPTFDWSCVLKSLQTSLEEYDVFMVPPNTCPAPCYVHTTCGECLDSRGGEGGSQECYWSEILKEVETVRSLKYESHYKKTCLRGLQPG